MTLFAFRHHRSHSPWEGAPDWALELRGIGLAILRQVQITEMEMTVDYAKLTADITAQTTVLQSAVTAFQGLSQSNADQATQIQTLKDALAAAQVADPAVQAALDALDTTVQSNTALIAGVMPAVTANTTTPAAAADAAAAAVANPPA